MAAAGGAASPSGEEKARISLALPKGRMKDGIFKLLEEAGIHVSLGNERGYRPFIPLEGYDCKLLKPQNILGMLSNGSRDLGFAGKDWVQELSADVVEVLDTGLDPVRIVAASPHADILERGGLDGRRLIVASEYGTITSRWIAEKGLDATFFRAYGATESLPPEDADIIVDNTATGSTLKANNLTIIDIVTTSSTCLFASKAAMADPAKRARIDEFVMLLQSVLEARKRKMITFNLPPEADDRLDEVVELLPCARAPTISSLRGGGHAVQVAVDVSRIPTLIPEIKSWGGSDIIVSDIHQIVA